MLTLGHWLDLTNDELNNSIMAYYSECTEGDELRPLNEIGPEYHYYDVREKAGDDDFYIDYMGK